MSQVLKTGSWSSAQVGGSQRPEKQGWTCKIAGN